MNTGVILNGAEEEGIRAVHLRGFVKEGDKCLIYHEWRKRFQKSSIINVKTVLHIPSDFGENLVNAGAEPNLWQVEVLMRITRNTNSQMQAWIYRDLVEIVHCSGTDLWRSQV